MGIVLFFAYNKLFNNEIGPVTSPNGQNTVESNVETYIRETISTLSPVEPVLGGSWYVVSVEVDAENNSGTVVYEDGHVQEKRDFTFTTDPEGGILTLTIK